MSPQKMQNLRAPITPLKEQRVSTVATIPALRIHLIANSMAWRLRNERVQDRIREMRQASSNSLHASLPFSPCFMLTASIQNATVRCHILRTFHLENSAKTLPTQRQLPVALIYKVYIFWCTGFGMLRHLTGSSRRTNYLISGFCCQQEIGQRKVCCKSRRLPRRKQLRHEWSWTRTISTAYARRRPFSSVRNGSEERGTEGNSQAPSSRGKISALHRRGF